MVSAAPSSPASRRPKLSAASPAGSTKPGSTGSSASITRLCLLILLLNCCGAIYHSRHDPWSVAFVAASFIDLALLFHLIHSFEAAPPGSAARGRIKAGVWSLTSILTVMFAYKVAALMPPPAAIAVWTMGAVTTVAGFCMLFLCGDAAEQGNSDDEPLKAAEDGANCLHEPGTEDGANKQHRSGGSLLEGTGLLVHILISVYVPHFIAFSA